jgi:outer membrane protein assembly factor BamB/orotate phosphoribosyltransferase
MSAHSDTSTVSPDRDVLRAYIEKQALVGRDARHTVLPRGGIARWSFDFRPLFMDANALDRLCGALWETLKREENIQLGGLETTAIALVAGMLLKGKEFGVATNGFYIRKSRDKDGLQNCIEGTVTDRKIVLMDDVLNSGSSILRQVKLLEAEGKKVHAISVIVRFRDLPSYTYFTERGIKIISLYTLDDFPPTGGVKEFGKQNTPAVMETPFAVEWKFQSLTPSFFHVVPKSTPVLDDTRLYFGTDNGSFWALNQSDGSVVWEHKPFRTAKDRHIFSSPALYDGFLYFGSHDGNVYALESGTGTVRWAYREADWVGSSPCVASELSLVYIGLQFGWWNKKGGIVALDAKSGKKKWWKTFSADVLGSPAYSKTFNAVVIGADDGHVYCYNAANGDEKWKFKADKGVRASFAFDEERGYVAFGSADRFLYVLNAETGAVVRMIETFEPIWSTPFLKDGRLYVGLLDRRILCADIESGNIYWTFFAKSRIFSTPELIDGKVYCGSNDGRLYVLDSEIGKHLETFQATERIMNKIAYNPVSKRIFIMTYANEVYCLSRENAHVP